MYFKKVIMLIAAAAMLSSCGAYRRLGYLQDMDTEHTYEVTRIPQTRIVRGDILNIQVLSMQPELAVPFNILYSSTSDAKNQSLVTAELPEYTVDEEGRINFPFLGPIMVEGLTLTELKSTLEKEIKSTKYLNDPIVKATFKNFKITVLGEVNSPGNYNFPTGEINIFELLGEIGDLTQSAQRDNIWVIRTTGGIRKVYRLNPKSRGIFDSPAYYLQQNDLVYVAPKPTKIDSGTQDIITWITTPLSLLSTTLSSWALVNYYTRH